MKRVESEWRNKWGTAKPYTRHESGCKHRDPDYNECRCPKWLYEYPTGGRATRRSLNTPSWKEARDKAAYVLRGFDPEIHEARKARKQQAVTLEEAVATYLADMATRLGENGTVAMTRSLLGDVIQESDDRGPKAILKVEQNGKLFDWLALLPTDSRPHYVRDLTPAYLTSFRSSWKFKSDLTAANRWTMLKSFLKFCEAQGWIDDNPARKLKGLTPAKGNRTAIFTDEQYAKILDAVPRYDPENVPELTRKSWQQRLTTFIELSRWSGMALVDAVQYRPELVDADGVLRYRRHKSGELATVPLPEHVIVMLRDVPLEHDSVGADMPFRSKDVELMSETAKWHRRLTTVFDLAGIKKVRNELGTSKPPHPHMLRDTFAVWHLRHGANLRTVSKMLGHAKTTTTEKAYLPWVKELEEAHIADARKALAKMPVPMKGKTSVVSIAAPR